jgi:ABC-2 type transporter
LKNPAVIIINISITAFLALVFGLIFNRVGANTDRADPTVVQSQLGAIINILISTMFGQSQTALTSFPAERPMFIREYATRHYGVVPYFLSRLATEAFQTLLATTIQAIIAYYMIGFQQTFWQFLTVTFSLAMTSTAVAVLLGSFFSDRTAAEAMFTVRSTSSGSLGRRLFCCRR